MSTETHEAWVQRNAQELVRLLAACQCPTLRGVEARSCSCANTLVVPEVYRRDTGCEPPRFLDMVLLRHLHLTQKCDILRHSPPWLHAWMKERVSEAIRVRLGPDTLHLRGHRGDIYCHASGLAFHRMTGQRFPDDMGLWVYLLYVATWRESGLNLGTTLEDFAPDVTGRLMEVYRLIHSGQDPFLDAPK